MLDTNGPITLDGISVHKRTGQLYRVSDAGQKEYLGKDVNGISRRFLNEITPTVADVAREQLMDFGLDPAELSDDDVARWVRADSPGKRRSVVKSLGGVTDSIDEHPEQWSDYEDALPPPPGAIRSIAPLGSVRSAPDCERAPLLRTALKTWEKIKADDRCDPTHLADVKRTFQRFIRVVGNKPIANLDADDFAQWQRWVNKQTTLAGRERSAKWHNDQHTYVSAVLHAVKRDRPSWDYPARLEDWLRGWKRNKYVPKKHNREALPSAIFKRPLAACGEYAATDPNESDKSTQAGRARRLQAARRRDEGARLDCILRLAAKGAIDNADLRRIRWEHLHLDAPIPHMNFARLKSQRAAGAPIDRLTPLLPNVVSALRKLAALDPTGGYVFKTAQGAPYSPNGFDAAFRKLADAAGIMDWTFKHVHNIAPSLGRRLKRPRGERDAILGHSVQGMSKFYEDDVDHTYLIDLVNLVGEHYFGGEHVVVPPV